MNFWGKGIASQHCTHHISLNTDTWLLQQVLLKASSHYPAIGIKYQLYVLSKTAGVVIECCAGIAEGLKDRIQL